MRLANRLCLIVVLLALPAAIAHATGNANNIAPCRTFTEVADCLKFCASDNLYDTCACFWDDPAVPEGFPLDHNSTPMNCSETSPCCWNRPCSTFGESGDCAIGGGGSVEPGGGVFHEATCHWFPSNELGGGTCGCALPLVDIPLPANQSEERFAPFDCDCPYLTHAEWSAQGGQGPCGPPPLDHFTLYKAKTTKGATKFVRFGPVVLTDVFRSNVSYQVTKPARLGLPANKNGEGVSDADTHREEYQVKPVAGAPKFTKRSDVHVVNQCNDLLIEVVKPVSLLVPTAKSLTDPVAAPDPVHHNLEHFLCYQAKAQTKLADGTALPKFPKGAQVDVEDQFQTRRYDLAKITKLCTPVDKSGTPTLLSGPDKGDAKPITPAVRVVSDEHLVCYQARLATKHIAQSGCGAADPEDKGTTIAPKQAKHAPRIGLHVANQFGAERLDSVKEAEICIPSQLDLP